jgi:serine/threonine protein kinase
MESIGIGAMGVVWQARDERLERTVAIKQLLVRPGLTELQTEDARRRAMREARLAARLQHRNAIALFDVAEHDGDPCLIMEFLRSRSLSTVLGERGTLPVDEVARIGAQIASALAAAHTAGIVHRDVKPGNILLDDTGLVKITDFGISRSLDDGTVTGSGGVAGTPAYLAPEVARGQEPSQSADVFSLGATLYHAVEGNPPFGTNMNPLALLHAVATGEVRAPHRAGALTGPLMSMLSPDEQGRPTMEEAAATLENLDVRRPPDRWQLQTVPVRQPPPVPTTQVIKTPVHQPPPVPTTQVIKTPVHQPPPVPKTFPAERDLVQRKGSRRTVVMWSAIAAAALVAGVVTGIIVSANKDSGQHQANPPASTSPVQRPSSTGRPSSTAAPVSGPINWSQAGQLVIDYYNGLGDPATTWGMLSGNGQAVFGDQQAFATYWGQYKNVSARNAHGVTPNADGSVNVPVDVTYVGKDGGSRPDHKVLKVINDQGRLAIDSEAR